MIRYLLAAVLVLALAAAAFFLLLPKPAKPADTMVTAEAEAAMREQIMGILGCTQDQANDIMVGLRVIGITEISAPSVENGEDGYLYLHFASGEKQYTVELSRKFKPNRVMDAEGNDLFVILY